ncbi:MAG: zf-HC2 domain-containing protein [Pyrinomonadaceae bacterium]
MNCEVFSTNLSLYLDDALPDGERGLCDGHLNVCPVCRAELAGMRSIVRGMQSVPRPAIPMNLSAAITDAIFIEAAAVKKQPRLRPVELIKHWLQPRLMPYTVGTFASLILFAMMFAGLRSSLTTFRAFDRASRNTETRFQVTTGYDVTQPITAEHFAARRSDYSPESPSLNPQGALAALSMNTARNLGDDDMVVVADVFSNGIASLADVVQPPRDPRMLSDFQDALRKDAAFVPAVYDRRPQTMRVVLVVTRVAVQ